MKNGCLLLFVFMTFLWLLGSCNTDDRDRRTNFVPPAPTPAPENPAIAEIRRNHKPITESTTADEVIRMVERMQQRISQYQIGETYSIERTSFAVRYRTDVIEFGKCLNESSTAKLERMYSDNLLLIVNAGDAFKVIERDDKVGLYIRVKLSRTGDTAYLVGWHFYD